MPNWCYNSLSIEAEPQVIAKIKAQLSAPIEGETEPRDLSFWNIIRPPADKMDEYHGIHGYTSDGKVGDTPLNWYNWNIENWGVKWDASEPEITDEKETYLSYRFNTPWGVAEEAMKALSRQYPNVRFDLEFEEETGWGGEVEFLDGESKIINEFAIKCYSCDTQWLNSEDAESEWDEDEHRHKCVANGYAVEKQEVIA